MKLIRKQKYEDVGLLGRECDAGCYKEIRFYVVLLWVGMEGLDKLLMRCRVLQGDTILCCSSMGWHGGVGQVIRPLL